MTGSDRAARLQMGVALAVGLALVAVPFFAVRRSTRGSKVHESPVAESERARAASEADAAAVAAPPAVTLSDTRVLECHDPGSRKTSPEQCDHLVTVEQAFARAVEQSAPCVAPAAGGGSLQFVLDVSFARKRNPYFVTVPKDGRAVAPASPKVAAACAVAVKRSMLETPLEGVAHAHARYKVALTATYPGQAKAPYGN